MGIVNSVVLPATSLSAITHVMNAIKQVSDLQPPLKKQHKSPRASPG